MIRPADQHRASTDYEELEDEKLVEVYCQTRDERAFQELHDRYAPRMIGKYSQKLDCREDAEELVQVTWMRVYRHLHRYDPEKGEFSTWAWTIAQRLMLNHWRNEGRDPQVNFSTITKRWDEDSRPLQWEDTSRMPDGELAKRETREILLEAIERMRPRFRRAIKLRELEGMTYREVAEETGSTIGTIKSRIHRARYEAFPDRIQEVLEDRPTVTSIRVLPDELREALEASADGADKVAEDSAPDLSPDAVAKLLETLAEEENEEGTGSQFVPGETTVSWKRNSSPRSAAHVILDVDESAGQYRTACGLVNPDVDQVDLDHPDAEPCRKCERVMAANNE